MATQPKFNIQATPKVKLSGYNALTRPSTKFNDDGVFNATWRMQRDEAQVLIDTLQPKADEIFEWAKDEHRKHKAKMTLHLPWADETDEDGASTGFVLFKAKQKAQFTDSNGIVVKTHPTVMDSQKNPIHEDVYSGSTAKIAFQPYGAFVPSNANVDMSLRLKAVQVFDLVSSNDGTELFDSEDDGYVATAASSATAVTLAEDVADAEADF